MLYPTSKDWLESRNRRVALFGMSGLGKTHVSNMLRDGGGWFHYSVDYRIGTRYMGEHIVDNFKREAMKVPFLRDLLRSDSIYIASNISFTNLAPLSTYLGKPGDPQKGGIPFAEYARRQEQHREAEIAALMDTPLFIGKARDIYGYDHFVADTGGSICEVIDHDDPADPVLGTLTASVLLVRIEEGPGHVEELTRRFDRAPKPMYYRPEVLERNASDYLAETGLSEDAVDPDDFIRWSFRRLIEDRRARYAAMARHGVTVSADEIAQVRDEDSFTALIASAIDRA
ncbi:MAG: ATPase [Rubricella sp.]